MSKDVVRDIKKATRRKFTAEKKIEIVIEGLRNQISVNELCRREGIHATQYYKWSKAFLEAGRNGLLLDTKRNATTDEVRHLREENDNLRRAVSETYLENIRIKKNLGLLGK